MMIGRESAEEIGATAITSTMRKARSLDFSGLRKISPQVLKSQHGRFASQFSQLAAKGFFQHSLCPMSREGLTLPDYGGYAPCDCRPYHTASKCKPWTTSSSATRKDDSDGVDQKLYENKNEYLAQATGRAWSMGRFSFIFLLTVALSDFAMCQIYDAIYPTAGENGIARVSLSSAAITSVTDALSPILPFAGGLDLRRLEPSKGSTVHGWLLMASEIKEAFATAGRGNHNQAAREDAFLSDKAFPPLVNPTTSSLKNRESVLGAAQPFMKASEIAELTLGDVAEAFRYALESSKEGYNEQKYVNNLAVRSRKMISVLSSAVVESRGKYVSPYIHVADSFSYGEIDALKFIAAMRILAEWRVLRLVPDGYKGFAVGMGLGHKDVVQNVAKVEHAVHGWLEFQTKFKYDFKTESELRSPTLKDLLEFEVRMELHPRLPRLRDRTGAMGLLWVMRQLSYQARLFENVSEVPSKFSDTNDAVAAAYKEVYDKYHGWAVQKIFSYSFQSAPPAEAIYRQMNPHLLKEITDSANILSEGSRTGLEKLADSPGLLEGGSSIFSLIMRSAENLPWSPFRPEKGEMNDTRGAQDRENPEVELYFAEAIIKDAHVQVQVFLASVKPLLTNIELLFDKMNMNDPTKV